MMKQLRWIGVLWAVMLAAYAGAAQAEVRSTIIITKRGFGPRSEIALNLPRGWVIDQEASEEMNIQVIVPEGKNFNTAPVFVYVHVFRRPNKEQSLADYIRSSNERWRADTKDAKISELPTVARVNGKEGFIRFAFENPGEKRQAYELGAFGIDSDKDGNEYFLHIFMSAFDKAALDRAESDYISFLKAH